MHDSKPLLSEQVLRAAKRVVATHLGESFEWQLAPASVVDEGIDWRPIEFELYNGLKELGAALRAIEEDAAP